MSWWCFKHTHHHHHVHHHHHHYPPPPKPKLASAWLNFASIGDSNMTTKVMHLGDPASTATLVLKDSDGNPASPAPGTTPTWSMSGSGVVDMSVAADGLSASFSASGLGSVDVDVLIQGDPVAGVNDVHAKGTLQVLAKEVATADLSFS